MHALTQLNPPKLISKSWSEPFPPEQGKRESWQFGSTQPFKEADPDKCGLSMLVIIVTRGSGLILWVTPALSHCLF